MSYLNSVMIRVVLLCLFGTVLTDCVDAQNENAASQPFVGFQSVDGSRFAIGQNPSDRDGTRSTVDAGQARYPYPAGNSFQSRWSPAAAEDRPPCCPMFPAK